MITQGMSAQEVWDHMMSKWDGLEPILMDAQACVQKKLKKLPPRQIGGQAIPYHYKPLNQDLLIVIDKTDQNVNGSLAMAILPYKNGKLFYNFTAWSRKRYMEVYTSHFFKRYQERMHSRHQYPTIIAEYAARTGITFQLYVDVDGCRAVYASRDGLSLCTFDHNKHLLLHRTFVSAEMLKATQREAYDIYMKRLDDIMGCTNKTLCKKYKSARDFFHEVERQDIHDIREIAGKIYAQYWEE